MNASIGSLRACFLPKEDQMNEDKLCGAILIASMVLGVGYWLGVVIPERDKRMWKTWDCVQERIDEDPSIPNETAYRDCRLGTKS